MPVKLIEVRTVGPSLGAENIRSSLVAALSGLALVAVFMVLVYRLPGLVSVLALSLYSLFNLAIYALIPVTLTLPGMFEVGAITDLAQQLGVAVLAKVIFSFSPDIVMSPLALPRTLLEPWIDELLPATHGAMHAVLTQLKQRPTFEEQWPDQYQSALRKGKARIQQLELIRPDCATTMAHILSGRPEVARWWHAI